MTSALLVPLAPENDYSDESKVTQLVTISSFTNSLPRLFFLFSFFADCMHLASLYISGRNELIRETASAKNRSC